MIYLALLIFPVMLKFFGLGLIADPMIKLLTRVMFPIWLLRWLLKRRRTLS
jgi:hypothetical protein